MTDLNTVVRTLNEPGWSIVDARLETALCVAPNSAEVPKAEFLQTWGRAGIAHAMVESGCLSLAMCGKGAEGAVLLSANLLDFRGEGAPCDTISISGPKVRTEQKKKVDGGGTREVHYDGLLLKLVHRERYNARLEAQRKADEAARAQAHAEAELRRREEEARREAERRECAKTLLDGLLKRVAGATVVKIEPTERRDGIVLTFSNGCDVTLAATTEDDYPPVFLIDDAAL